VGIGPTGHGGFGLTGSLDLHAPRVSAKDAAALMKLCPYSNATRGNIDVTLTVEGSRLPTEVGAADDLHAVAGHTDLVPPAE
jgi:hypothetical protein